MFDVKIDRFFGSIFSLEAKLHKIYKKNPKVNL